MGCIYSDFNGVCQLYDPDFPLENFGCKEDCICICEEDPDPSEMCENYESDGEDFDEEDDEDE